MISAQLSLFDTATVMKPAYQVGDLVKLRKKPSAASYVKKGDIVEISAVHPINGTIKFWNERSERCDFIYPDEISSIVPREPADSVASNAEVGVTESIPEPADSVTSNAEVGVTELISEPADSVTSNAEVGVTESIPEPADSVTSNAEVGVTESIPEPADSVTSSAVSTYRPRGTARSIENVRLEYFRFSYREGSKVRHVHIKGGNTDSPRAQAKVAEVRSLLAAGIAPREVAAMLRNSNPPAVDKI
jgi:hypothetical protein